MPQRFYKHICKDEHFLYLNGKNFLQPKVSDIMSEFLKEGKENYLELRNNLSHYKDILQYVCYNVFSAIHCSTQRRGSNLKSIYHIMFKTYKDKKN